MLIAEILQVGFSVVGAILTALWIARCLRNLHTMYRAGRNGTMVLQAWEKIIVGCVILCLQLLWAITAVSSFGIDAMNAGELRFETSTAVRGAIGSALVLVVVMIKRWVWIRILERDNDYT